MRRQHPAAASSNSRRPRVRGALAGCQALDRSPQLAGGRTACPPGLPGSRRCLQVREGSAGWRERREPRAGGGGGAAEAAVSPRPAEGQRLPH